MNERTQIWEVAPHFCGLHSDVARRRLLLVLKMFIDESGKGQKPLFVMGGYIARAEQWASFDDEWRAVLNAPPRIDSFHMAEAIRRPAELAKLPALMKVIKDHSLAGIVTTVRTDDFEEVLKGRIAPAMDRPYSLMFYSIILECLQWEADNGLDEKIDFIFDEQHEESDRLLASWSDFVKALSDDAKRIIGGRPIFVSDLDYPPLQAADILAFSFRRVAFLKENGAAEPDPYLPIVYDREIPLVEMQWTKERLQGLYAEGKAKNAVNGRLFKHEAKMIDDNVDRFISGYNVHMVRTSPPWIVTNPMSIQAIGTKRYRLVDKCPAVGTPHLYKKSTDACLERRRPK